MASVITGLLKDAFDLSISEITVRAHRGRAMRKMQAESLLAEMAMKLRRLGQMSRFFDATLSLVGRDDYSRKFCRPGSRGPNYQLCLARWSIIAKEVQ
jgi:hypothetical protein